MPIRKVPSTLPGEDAPLPAMGMQMPPRPPMTGAPANNPAPGMPGPESGAMGAAPAPAPPPLQPGAGGPTSPLNIQQSGMLNPQQQLPATGGAYGQPPGGAPARTPLPPWGDSQGSASLPPDGVSGEMPGQTGSGGPSGTNVMHAGSPSLVMLRMLKALGQLG